ncbi:DNA-3-methyladenine glycosylase family protein [Pollutimonas bauzanensis]|uniref:DNA-3-methyladenine glycosylase II n=1 Tax=Pollutimonas bauzanensis TaxID=658167 RepID=A0A1M5SM97_9BURK|nr:DNA-3-methyladenine glycosylase [Pollutimonas bauzanensis]SHH39053.1 DNA-3-methyladenine glycosylase II [Pollutimonas bauzanensis]
MDQPEHKEQRHDCLHHIRNPRRRHATTAAMPLKDRLSCAEVLARHLQSLLRLDPRLSEVHAIAGPFAPRIREPGFAGLARIVCGQQVSVASANAIWNRLEAQLGAVTPERFLDLDEEGSRSVGLSRSKYRSLTDLAEVVAAGGLDFAAVAELPAEAAIAELTRHKGIGPWTAEIYLMFCAGHPDIFPAGDLALQKAVGDAFGMEPHPDRRALMALAARWAPYRATAALLFWRFYAARRKREGLAL